MATQDAIVLRLRELSKDDDVLREAVAEFEELHRSLSEYEAAGMLEGLQGWADRFEMAIREEADE